MLLESGFDFTLSSPNGTERDASAAMEKEEDQTSGHFFSEFPVDEDSGSCSSSSTSRDSHPATSSSVDSGSQQQHHDHVEDLPSPQVGYGTSFFSCVFGHVHVNNFIVCLYVCVGTRVACPL